MRSLVLIFLSCLFSAVAFGLGSPFPKQSYRYEPPILRKSGTVFTMEMSGSSYGEAQDRLLHHSSQSCESREARRISSWQHLHVVVVPAPSDCKDFQGKKYCRGGSDIYLHPVRAKFRCE